MFSQDSTAMTTPDTISGSQFAHLDDDWESASRYLSIFIDESFETLDELTEALLALEAGGGRENIEQLFIAAHRIKGSAASIGLNRVAKLAHLMEDLLQMLVDDKSTLTPEMADGMLACTDGLRQYVDALRSGRPAGDSFDELARKLPEAKRPGDAASDHSPPESQPQPPAAETQIATVNSAPTIDAELRQLVAATVREDETDDVLVGRVIFEPELPLVGLKARLVVEKLSNLGNICYINPPADGIENRDEIGELAFGIVANKPIDDVRRLLHVSGVQDIVIEPLGPIQPATKAAATSRAAPADPGAKPNETLRVDIERLDRLMNLAGQLAIGKARVAQIGEKLKNVLTGEHSVEILSDLFETIHLLDGVSDGIRQNVMDMRMVPIGPLFGRFHRVIRDITRANGKDIRLVVSGEKTELDKRMIDELGDPMIHLIRNAADHGIETPETRQAAGKPPQGTISLDACHRGSSVVIRVSDDGRGLDPERIRAKAVEKGLVTAADAELMTTQQIYQFIWLPGLSTAEKVTDVSGRGVGMDIVRSKIKDLNGTVEVQSELGRGTTFTVKLPLTLAVLPSLMVEIGGDAFAIPLESVLEIVHVDRGEVSTAHGQQIVAIRDRIIAILTLGAVFKWRQRQGAASDAGQSDRTVLVIIGEKDRQLGLAVDRVIGEEDVVIKSIAENYRNVAGVAGASILGDGRISLILDPTALIEMSSHPALAADSKEKVI
jgi:two-component system, chemotaxis family, sensor kinase CheA